MYVFVVDLTECSDSCLMRSNCGGGGVFFSNDEGFFL